MGDWWVNFWRTAFLKAQISFFFFGLFTSLFNSNFMFGVAWLSLLLYPKVLSVLITIQKGISNALGALLNQGAPAFAMPTASWYLSMLFPWSGCLTASSNNVRNSLFFFHPSLLHQECWCTHLPGPQEHSTRKPRLTGSNVTALPMWAHSPCCTQTNWTAYLHPACFWWIQECFLCPSCPTLVWKRWFKGFNNVAGG